MELNTGVAQARLLITGIHTLVAPQSNIHWLLFTFHNTRWMDHCEVWHGSIEAILILDPLDVGEAYHRIASCYHIVQWHFGSHGRRDASFAYKENSMEARLVLCCAVSLTEAVQILCWSNSNDWHASHFCTYCRSFLGSCDHLESGTRDWILILRTRYPILSNKKRPLWSIWRMNTVPDIDECQLRSTKAFRAAILSTLQRIQDPVNHLLIHMICPAMMMNT